MAHNISLENLPTWVKLEVSKSDLEAFAQTLLAQSKNQVPNPSASTKKIMTVDELSSYANLAKATIYGLTSKNQIPYHKSPKGRKLYFVKSDIDEWLTSNRRATTAEIEAQAIRHIEEQKKKRRIR